MAVTSNDKEVEALLDLWHESGARVERYSSKANVIKVYPPNGADMIAVHTTVSDVNHLKILRGFGRRAGLPAYPGDTHMKETTMSTAAAVIDFPQIDLPPNILERTAARPTDAALGAVRGAVEYLARHGGDGTFWTREVTNLVTGYELMPLSTVTNRVPQTLYWLGYRPVEEKKYGRGSQYRWAMVDGLDKAAKEILPRTFLKGEIEVEPEQVDEPVVDERMVTHHENDGHDHGETPAVEDITPDVPEPEMVPENADVLVWQGEAERLEAELVEVKGARIVVDQEVIDLRTRLDESRKMVDEAEQKRERVEYTLKHEIDLQHEQIQAQKAGLTQAGLDHAYWKEQHDNVKRALDASQQRESDLMREQSMQVLDDGWTTLDIQKLATQRDGYTLDELMTDAAVFGLEVRIQRH